MKAAGAGIQEYLKRAFLYRWNLLLFLGSFAASLLSPWPGGMLPLVLAAEVAYLGGLVSTQKFRDAIDAQVYKEGRQPPPLRGTSQEESLVGVMNSIAPEARRRFETLRGRCLEMRFNRARRWRPEQLKDRGSEHPKALDRLLWVFLRLLASQQGLDRFLCSSTSDATPRSSARLAEIKTKLENVSQDERFKRSLQDSAPREELWIAELQESGG